MSLFSLYGQWFPRYGPIFKICHSSEILAILHFPIGHNVKCQSVFLKKFKFEISKFQEARFMWIVTGNIHKKFGRKRIKIVGGAAF